MALQTLAIRLREGEPVPQDADDMLGGLPRRDRAAWCLVLAGHRAVITTVTGMTLYNSGELSADDHLETSAAAAVAALGELEALVGEGDRQERRPSLALVGDGWPGPAGVKADAWGCTLVACACDAAGKTDLTHAVLAAMRRIGTPLLSSRGYIGPPHFVPVLDAIHARLGKRGKFKARVEAAVVAAGIVAAVERCGACGLGFGSRNRLFKHLRSAGCTAPDTAAAKHPATRTEDDADVGRGGVAAGPPRPPLPPPGKPKNRPPKAHRRAPPELSAVAATLWFGGIPAEFATAKKVGNLIWSCKPRSMPMPYVSYVTRKGYRQGSRLHDAPADAAPAPARPTATCAADLPPPSTARASPAGLATATASTAAAAAATVKRATAPAPWVGYAFVVFRDAAEATDAQQHFEGLSVEGWTIRVKPREAQPRKPASAPLGRGVDPPLGHRLFPVSLGHRDRAAAVRRHCNAIGMPVSQPGSTTADLDERAAIDAIKAHYRANPRREIACQGVPLPPGLLTRLRGALITCRWPPIHSRTGMRASHYLVIHVGKVQLLRHRFCSVSLIRSPTHPPTHPPTRCTMTSTSFLLRFSRLASANAAITVPHYAIYLTIYLVARHVR